MLTSEQRREVIREMKADRPVAWPAEDELVQQFVSTVRDLYSVEVPADEARVAIARGRFRD